ncbi:hypothetical protein FACS189427_03080 [Planctomycetales bacterium]|nr:hypothetical protein FACS189427_03080 [Planctomycetales bacterium]
MSTAVPKPLTYEQLMAMILETSEQMKKTDRQMKETDKKIAALGDRIGELIETIVEGGILQRFQALNYDFTQCSRHLEFRNKELGIAGEIDLFLENGDYVLAAEVKTNLSVSDVKEHSERLEKYRRYLDAKGAKAKIIGAVGGGVIRENVKQFAMKNGFFVIIQTGDSVNVLPPEGRKVKEW